MMSEKKWKGKKNIQLNKKKIQMKKKIITKWSCKWQMI